MKNKKIKTKNVWCIWKSDCEGFKMIINKVYDDYYTAFIKHFKAGAYGQNAIMSDELLIVINDKMYISAKYVASRTTVEKKLFEIDKIEKKEDTPMQKIAEKLDEPNICKYQLHLDDEVLKIFGNEKL